MDASCEIQGSIHVCLILRYVCPGNWVHISTSSTNRLFLFTVNYLMKLVETFCSFSGRP